MPRSIFTVDFLYNLLLREPGKEVWLDIGRRSMEKAKANLFI